VKKLIAGFLILTAMVPVALMTGCGSNTPASTKSPTATPTVNPANATATSIAIAQLTATFTPTATRIPVSPPALVLGAASSTGPGGNFSLLIGTSDTVSSYPYLSGNVGHAVNGAVGTGTDVLIGGEASGLFTSTGTSANIYWTTGGVSPDPAGYAVAANVAIFGPTGAYVTGSNETYQTALAATELEGLSLAPGTYTSTGALTLGASAPLTLNNTGGNPNNCYIFVTGAASNLTTSAGSSMILLNVLPANVFWIVGASATLGGINSTSVPPVAGFIGTLMCSTSITFLANATIEGHAFCNSGSISFAAGNEIYYP